MMTCRDFEGLVTEYLDGELSQNIQHQMEEHLSSCQACAQKINSVKMLCRQLKNLMTVKTSAEFENMLRARIRLENRKERYQRESFFSLRRANLLAYAVALVVVVLAGFFITQQVRRQQSAAPQAAANMEWQNGQAIQQQKNSGEVIVYYVDREPAMKILSPRNFVRRLERTKTTNPNQDTIAVSFSNQKMTNLSGTYYPTKSY